jgi:hypothetical protein
LEAVLCASTGSRLISQGPMGLVNMPMGCPVDALTCPADCKLQCIPEDRAWRSQRCDRCIRFGYPCSANATAQGIQRRVSHADDATLRCSAEIPSQMARGMCLPKAGPFSHVSASSKKQPFDALHDSGSGNPELLMNVLQQPAVYVPVIPACASLFSKLGKACWDYFGHSSADPLLVSLTAVYSNAVHQSLGRRLMLVRIYRNQQEICRILPANGGTGQGSPWRQICPHAPYREQSDFPRRRVQDARIWSNLCGSRWNELVDAVGLQAVLLIDE